MKLIKYSVIILQVITFLILGISTLLHYITLFNEYEELYQITTLLMIFDLGIVWALVIFWLEHKEKK